MVKIKMLGAEAVIDGYVWLSNDDGLQELLQSYIDPLGPSGSDPYPDLTAAQMMVDLFGGEVVEFDEPPLYDERMRY